MNELELYQEKIFEDIKHTDEEGKEYWFARELMKYYNIQNGTILKL